MMDHEQSANAFTSIEQIVRSIPGALFQIVQRDRDSFAFTYVSPQAEELFGLNPAALLLDPALFYSRMSAADSERCKQSLHASACYLTPFLFTFSLSVHDDTRWFTCQANPHIGPRDELYWTGQFLHFTPEQQAIRQLDRSRNLLMAAQKQARLGLWEFELATGKIAWSPEVFEIHGVDIEQGEPDMAGLATLYHPEDFPRLAAAVQATIQTGEPYFFDLRIIRPANNEMRYVSATGGVLKNPITHLPELLYGTILDITDRVRLQESLEAARDEAESNARAKANFVASMSHELRTPLNGIVGMTSLLRSSELNPLQRKYCETIHKSADALMAIVNDVLDWSRIGSGKIDLEQIPLDLKDLLDSVIEMLQPQADNKLLHLALELDRSDFPMLLGDPTRLRQILLNLGANAIKFTARGSVRMRVGRVSLEDNQMRFRIEVVDTGIGIDSAQQQRLFHRFSQADASTTRKFGGSGLGLAISKSLTELMGGEIGVESEAGTGSTFWLQFQLPVASQQAPRNLPVHELQTSTTTKPLRILVAEDNEVNQQLASLILEQAGHEFELCGNGLLAMERAILGDHDLILMDCQMPDMDGFEATRLIREKITRNVPIIGVTASALLSDRDDCLAAGMNDFLPKPYRAEELLRIVQKWGQPA